ncbi:UNVERIFIED_CONTAM: SH3 domain-containing protein 2 [Sesamum radiatum]|uniref:SH3 domain-containing protein 2 n=1 Tax=Sesamum radiatum TaxID=300843 RepID=A0AAW2S3B8_SESRA
MVMGAPLDDARHLAQRYDRMRQDAETQAFEVARRQAKVREGNEHPDLASKLEAAEAKLQDLKSNTAVLGKEAASALAAVEDQQQRLTLQRLTAMVMYSYQAESDVELNLSIGDYIVVRKVSNNGWAEGECKGKAGWFPFGYIERRERVFASKVAEVF